MPDRDRISQGRFDRELVTVPVTSAPRVVRWWPLILVALGLVLLTPRVLGLKEEPVWLSTFSDILGAIAILAGFVVFALAGRDGRESRLVALDQVQLRTADFPFHIVHSITELTNILLPDPTGEVPLPDRDVPYIPRDLPDLDRAFLEKGRVLLRGRSKTGKTRAVIELLRGYWRTSPTVLVLKRTAELRAPTFVPDDLPRRNLVILADDLHAHALACRRRRTSVGVALSDVVDFFVQHCGNQLSEVRLIAIVRREPECWEQIDFDPAKSPWPGVELIDLADLLVDEARRLVVELGDMSPPLGLASEIADAIARSNDGTFYRLILAFRDWRSQPNKREITAQDVASLQADLASAWRHRRSVLFQHRPQLCYVYGALDLAQVVGIPARQDLIAILAQSLRGDLIVRTHTWTVEAQKWVQMRFPGRHCLRRIATRTGRALARAVARVQGMLLWLTRRLLGAGLGGPRRCCTWVCLLRITHWVSLIFVSLGVSAAAWGPLWLWLSLTRDLFPSLLWLTPMVPVLLLELAWIGMWMLEQIVLVDRISLRRVVQYVGDTEIPVVESILVPYDSQVEGAAQAFSTQAWVLQLMQARDSTLRNRFLSSALQRWFHKADFGAVGWEVGVCVGELLIRLGLKSQSVYSTLRKCYLRQDRLDEAISTCQRAIELNPDVASFHNNLGIVYRSSGRYEEAIVVYQRAIELEPDDATFYSNLGRAYRELGRYEEAIAAYQRAIELFSTYAYPHNGLGNVYRALGRQEEAIAAFQRAVELDPADAAPHNGLGNVYADLGRPEEAIAAYQRAIELDPNDATFQSSFAAACRELGREEEYEKHIRRARELMANERDYIKACIESIAGNVEAALEHLARALEKAPGYRQLARRDPDLAFIRDHPRFRELAGEDDRG